MQPRELTRTPKIGGFASSRRRFRVRWKRRQVPSSLYATVVWIGRTAVFFALLTDTASKWVVSSAPAAPPRRGQRGPDSAGPRRRGRRLRPPHLQGHLIFKSFYVSPRSTGVGVDGDGASSWSRWALSCSSASLCSSCDGVALHVFVEQRFMLDDEPSG